METAPANALSSSEKMLNELEMQKPEGALAVSRSSRSWQDIGCNDPSMLVLVVARIRVEGLCSLSPLPVAQSKCCTGQFRGDPAGPPVALGSPVFTAIIPFPKWQSFLSGFTLLLLPFHMSLTETLRFC